MRFDCVVVVFTSFVGPAVLSRRVFLCIKITMKYYTYILRCSDGTLYTGYTNDLNKRISDHNSGKGAKYTKVRLPVELVYYEEYESKSEAMSREWHIKHDMTRAEKESLIKSKQS